MRRGYYQPERNSECTQGNPVKAQKMKFMVTPKEIAASAAAHAMTEAIAKLTAGIKSCGELCSTDSKQSPANKQYFSDQAEALAEAITHLTEWRSEIATRGK